MVSRTRRSGAGNPWRTRPRSHVSFRAASRPPAAASSSTDFSVVARRPMRAAARRSEPPCIGIRSAAMGSNPCCRSSVAEGPQRVEGEVLVVERVPLELLEQVARVHHLEAEDHRPAVSSASTASRMAAGSALWAKTLLPGDQVDRSRLVAQLVDDLRTETAGQDVTPLLARPSR